MRGPGWTAVHKGWRFHGVAPDGQAVHLYLNPYRRGSFAYWTVSLFIGRSNREANDWHNKQKPQPSRITGRGSISALRFALARLLDFAGQMTKYEELQVSWEDERRRRAYRWLLRLPNWQVDETCLHYRNPTWWEDVSQKEVT